LGDVLRKAQIDGLLPLINPTRQHHVDHAGLAHQIGDPDRSTTAGEEAALALGQGEIGRLVHYADMCGAGQFQPAADNCAFESRDDRHAAIFHLVEGFMPAQANVHEISRAAVGLMMLDQVKASAEMVARSGQHNGPDTGTRGGGKELDQFFNRVGIQRVAF